MLSDKQVPSVRQLQYFVAVANTLNFRRAAEQLGISQPALTSQIAALEGHLGLKLFERSRVGSQLSPEGRELLPHAREVLLSVQGFGEIASFLAGGQQATYRLGVPPTLGPYLLPNVLPDLHQHYLNLKLYVREDAPRAILRGLVEGAFDLAIVPSPVLSAELSAVPLFTEPLKFVVSADHPLAEVAVITPQSLRGEKILTLEERHHFHHQVQEICEELGAVVQRDYEGTSLDTLRQMVVMGLGSAFLPGLYIHSEMHRPEALKVCEIKGIPIRRQHSLVWRANASSRVFYRELAGYLKSIIHKRLGNVVVVADEVVASPVL